MDTSLDVNLFSRRAWRYHRGYQNP